MNPRFLFCERSRALFKIQIFDGILSLLAVSGIGHSHRVPPLTPSMGERGFIFRCELHLRGSYRLHAVLDGREVGLPRYEEVPQLHPLGTTERPVHRTRDQYLTASLVHACSHQLGL